MLTFVAPEFAAHFSGPLLYGLLALLGASIGFLTGFFGLGGGFLLVPLLNILIGIPYELAAGSTLCFILGTSTNSFLKQARIHNVEYKVVAAIAPGNILGTLVGDILQNRVLVGFGRYEDFQNLMHILYIFIIGGCILLLSINPREKGGKSPLQKLPLGPRIDLSGPGLRGVSLPGLLFIGLGLGVMTGFMGIGGGVLIIPILLMVVGLPSVKTAGTSLGIVFFGALTGVIKKGLGDIPKVSLLVAMALLAASALGIQLGYMAAKKTDQGKFKKWFILILILAIFIILVDLVFF